MKSVRTFIGLFPPPDIQSKVAEIQSELRREPADIRWELHNKFHVTMKFLGDISPEQLARLTDLLQAACATVVPFEVTLMRVGCFPDARSPKVIWVGSSREENVPLVDCFQNVEASCVAAGFKRDLRPFHPHITVGRVKGNIAERLIKSFENTTFEPLKFPCSNLLIMKSDLSPSGSTYSTQRTISLKH